MKKMFARRLYCLRKQRGLTQVIMSKKLNVARQTYLDLESGKTEPRISTITDIAEILNVEPIYLLQPALPLNSGLSSYSTEDLLSEVFKRVRILENG